MFLLLLWFCTILLKLSRKGPGNPFGKKADIEVAQTYTWIQSHLEEDPNVSLPKHEVYDEYRCFCQSNQFEPLCVADFGKAMKHIFPKVKPRRLGQRGNSRYCYSGLRKKMILPAPSLPDLSESPGNNGDKNVLVSSLGDSKEDEPCDDRNFSSDLIQRAVHRLVIEWAEKCLGQNFNSIEDLGRYLINCDLVDKDSMAAFALISSNDDSGRSRGSSFDSKSSKNIQLCYQRRITSKANSKELKKKTDRSKSISCMPAYSYSNSNGTTTRRGGRRASLASQFNSDIRKSSESSFPNKLKLTSDELVEVGRNTSINKVNNTLLIFVCFSSINSYGFKPSSAEHLRFFRINCLF